MAKVELQNISKTFGSQTIIASLNLSIRSGEFMVLVGPSGCGKSTILRMVAGLEEPTLGTILIDDNRVNELSPKARGVAMVFQNYALYPHMSVRENLAFSLKLSRITQTEIDRRVAEVADVLGIQELLGKKPSKLSGGQKQRVAMGRAMVRNPAVFLFDEPLSNLDAQLRVKMRSEISLLHRRLRSTVIYVTHDQVEAMTLADRIAVLNRGHLEQVGPPLEVYHQPKTAFVASFIGTPSMNFLPVSSFSNHTFPSETERVGFRPESTQVGGDLIDRVLIGQGKVSLVEILGLNAHVHFQMRETTLVSEMKTTSVPKVDSEVNVWVSPSQLFFFNRDGVRLEN